MGDIFSGQTVGFRAGQTGVSGAEGIFEAALCADPHVAALYPTDVWSDGEKYAAQVGYAFEAPYRGFSRAAAATNSS